MSKFWKTIIVPGIFNQSYKISKIPWMQLKQMCPQNSALLSSLEPRVKANEDHIKHIDNTLDGLKISLNSLASKQGEDAEKLPN